jgi:tetratricopeptide (TPR) repeat protein
MKMRGGLFLTLAFGLLLSGCASGGGGTTAATPVTTAPSGSGANLLAQGARPRETDNTDAAEEALGEAQEAQGAGNAGVAQAQYQAALQAAQAAITEDPTNPLAYRLAGYAALGAGDHAAAAGYFDEAVTRRPVYELDITPARENGYIDAFGLAIPLLQAGQYMEATEHLEAANTIYPNRAEAIITLSQIYAQEGQHELALERIDAAMAFLGSDRMADVDSATAAQWRTDGAGLLQMKGQVYVAMGRFDEAVQVYRQVAAEDPNNLNVVQDIAAILMTTGREDEAMVVYNELLSRPGLTAADFYRIGVGFYNASDYERAADAFGRGVGVSSRDRDGIEMWARSLQLDSAYAAAQPVARRWMELDPSNQNAIIILAQAINYGGDAQGAAAAMRQIESLLVTVDDLELRRGVGSAVVSGSVANRSIQPGDRVTLTFTFYSDSGQALGTATHQATVQGVGQKQVFQVEFQSTQPVGGYGYTLVRG